CSQRVYPAESSCSASAPSSACPPTSRVMARDRRVSGGRVRAMRPSAVATTTGASPWARAYSAARRLRSQSREPTAPGRNCHSRPSRVTGHLPVRVSRSAERTWTSRSSPQRNTAGRPQAAATAAPTQARCTGWRPLTAAGQPPSSTRRISSAASGIVCNCLRNCSIGCGPCQHEKLGRLSGRRAASGRMARWAFSARRLFGGRGCKADGHDSPTQVISTGTIRENGSVLSVFPFTGRHARRQK
ncbi:permease prefix domain 1-containing protein, partial [Dysosmobacter welbionis]